MHSDNLDTEGNTKTINVLGHEIDNPLYNGNPMYLFTAHYDDGTANSLKHIDIGFSKFSEEYQTISPDVSMTLDGEEVTLRKYATFINANSNEEQLSKAVYITDMDNVSEFIKKGDDYAASRKALVCAECLIYDRWFHGKTMDFKDRKANKFSLTYVEGLGMFESDAIANIAFGWAWGGYKANSVHYFMSIGDYGQKDQPFKVGDLTRKISGIDDPFDSYLIALGWQMRAKYDMDVKLGLLNIHNIISSFNKSSTSSPVSNKYNYQYFK